MNMLWASIKNYPRFFAVLFFVILLVMLVDFTRRVWVGSEAQMRQFDETEPKVSVKPLSVAEAKSLLSGWLPEKPPQPVVEPQLVLKGVFGTSSNKLMASIAVVNPIEGTSQLVLVREGDLVQGWTASEIEKNSVVLIRAGETQPLRMFPGRQ
jgi:hypothetical protein